MHRLAEAAPVPGAGARLVAEIDWSRRYRLMRMHSAMHLLCAAVACPVTGGQVGADRSRLDFDLGSLGRQGRARPADRPLDRRGPADPPPVDRRRRARRPAGAGEDHVGAAAPGRQDLRLVEIEGVDLQACGGTHVRSTGEIGPVTIGKIENKGRQNRRINIALGA